ncbi:YbdK family carboxylate-amine ligase [Microlunatus elymi]|uniref:Putative glutamate--cysteine ligase 2 n=1 Tax=Microlunatus elymi TaxID=2596828 RepID=A0A516PWZ3_9ACTN|nr:glutamate--cysteine ligase [Microlunatus elymi]QDP95461.1 YbdK family carboxylate-amine ligase [Microlunatus elymi]
MSDHTTSPAATTERRTVGVEEELLLVDADSGVPRAVAGNLLRRAEADRPRRDEPPRAPDDGEIEAELQQQQIEVETSPCADLSELRRQLVEWRQYTDQLARKSDARVLAMATSPLPVDPRTMVKPRYRRMVERYGLTTMEQLTCGCHVHVSVADDEEGVGVVDRVQRRLPALLALSANSPFWQGRDSGYSSYRTQVWSRFPTAGPTAPFGSAAAYHERVERLVRTGVLLDPDMIYFNVRLSRHYPTVEFRIADICLRADDAVMIAALARALVDTAAADIAVGRSAPSDDPQLLLLAQWRASRDGLRGGLLDPVDAVPQPAAEVIETLLDHVRGALTANGDLELVQQGIDRVFENGTGAELQRRAVRDGAEPVEMVRALLDTSIAD